MKTSKVWPMLALALGAIACSDSGLEPKAAPHAVSAELIGTKSHGKGDTTVTNFTIDPQTATTFDVGDSHSLFIPAHAVCDLATSSYGPTEWDKPCTPMTERLVIKAKSWTNKDGLPQVDFSPSLRFNPKAAGAVFLFLKVTSSKALKDNANIRYCATLQSVCVNEQLTDRSLVTLIDPITGYAYRRIKHFSGYNVSSGKVPGEPSQSN